MKLSNETGSVTAELAVTLPAVGVILALVLGVFGLQVQRLALVADAAMASRAVARGEAEAAAEQLVAQPKRAVEFTTTSDLVCAKITQPAQLAGLPVFDLSEKACARKAGF